MNAVIVAIDQLTKAVVRNNMFIGESKPIINNFFHLTYITNDGMAFGLDFPGGSFLFNFVSISLTIFLTACDPAGTHLDYYFLESDPGNHKA